MHPFSNILLFFTATIYIVFRPSLSQAKIKIEPPTVVYLFSESDSSPSMNKKYKKVKMNLFRGDGHIIGTISEELPTKRGGEMKILKDNVSCSIDSLDISFQGIEPLHMTLQVNDSVSEFDGTISKERFFYLSLNEYFCKLEFQF